MTGWAKDQLLLKKLIVLRITFDFIWKANAYQTPKYFFIKNLPRFSMMKILLVACLFTVFVKGEKDVEEFKTSVKL